MGLTFKNEPDLRPCPFCGGEAKVSRKKVLYQGDNELVAFVYCRNCNARTSYMLRSKYEHYMRKAIEAWNRRFE